MLVHPSPCNTQQWALLSARPRCQPRNCARSLAPASTLQMEKARHSQVGGRGMPLDVSMAEAGFEPDPLTPESSLLASFQTASLGGRGGRGGSGMELWKPGCGPMGWLGTWGVGGVLLESLSRNQAGRGVMASGRGLWG